MSESTVVPIRKYGSPHYRVRQEPGGKSMTKQSEAAATDINTIMAKYLKTGLVEHVNKYQGVYEDVTGAVDYQTALNIVIEANEMFMGLPASIRSRFENDPHQFLDFAQNPDNAGELVEMGLAKPMPPTPTPGTDEPPLQTSVAATAPATPAEQPVDPTPDAA